MKIHNYIIVLTLLGSAPAAQAEDKFGRFFTTPQQRQTLDELRERRPEDITIELAEDDFGEEPEQQERIPINVIRFRGLVHRHNGKSTAWLNDGNTYEGGIGSQYIDIDRIVPGGIILDITGDERKVELKAGQSYDPSGKKIHDLIRE